jgi:transcriptional regulator with XRE-family HTH domain
MLLKELLVSKGLKQKWLANKMGVSEVTVSSWCSGKNEPNKERIQKLSELLEVRFIIENKAIITF